MFECRGVREQAADAAPQLCSCIPADSGCDRSVMLRFVDSNENRERGGSSSRRMVVESFRALMFAAEAIRQPGSG